MKNIHRIFEKTPEYEPYEFAKVNTVAPIQTIEIGSATKKR